MLSRKQKTVTAESSQRTHHCLQGTRGTRRNPRTWNHIRNPNAPARRKRVERRSEARSKDACNLEVALNFFFAQKEIRSYQQAELPRSVNNPGNPEKDRASWTANTRMGNLTFGRRMEAVPKQDPMVSNKAFQC